MRGFALRNGVQKDLLRMASVARKGAHVLVSVRNSEQRDVKKTGEESRKYMYLED